MLFYYPSQKDFIIREKYYNLIQDYNNFNNWFENNLKYLEKDYIYDSNRNKQVVYNCNTTVNLTYLNLSNIPIQFNIINGDFICAHNKLTSLKGCPKIVLGKFDCSYNYLTNLNYFPKLITGPVDCSNNYLVSLRGINHNYNYILNISKNYLTNLTYCPKILYNLYCSYNPIKLIKNLIIKNDLYCFSTSNTKLQIINCQYKNLVLY